jgi:hypothetical protein
VFIGKLPDPFAPRIRDNADHSMTQTPLASDLFILIQGEFQGLGFFRGCPECLIDINELGKEFDVIDGPVIDRFDTEVREPTQLVQDRFSSRFRSVSTVIVF